MPRGPRLDAPGTLHHVIARGIERRNLFKSEVDREDFLSRMDKLLSDTKTRLYAWCLLPNHFHLLLRSGDEGLSAFMRRLQTGYAVGFNRRHRRVGHLFQNRYKSILVEEDAYFLELVRYIHLNPVRACLVKNMLALDRYAWCGHAAVMGKREAPFQDVAFVLQQFGVRTKEAIAAYRGFVAEGIRQGKRPELSGGGLVRSVGGREKLSELRRSKERMASDERILGSSDFVLEIEKEMRASLGDESSRVQVPPEQLDEFMERLQSRIAREFEVDPAELKTASRRRVAVAARAVLCWVLVRNCGLPAGQIARKLGISSVTLSRLQRRGLSEIRDRGLDVEGLLKM